MEVLTQSVAFVDGHTVTKVHHDVRRVSLSEWDSLGRPMHGGHVERLKPGLRHALSVRLGASGHKKDALQAQ